MEATSKENPRTSLTNEGPGIESNTVARRYLEFLDHVIENSARKILNPKKLASYMQGLEPTHTGHITALSEQIQAWSNRVLKAKVYKMVQQLSLQALDHEIWKKKHCPDIEFEDFSEVGQFQKQMTNKILDFTAELKRENDEEENGKNPE